MDEDVRAFLNQVDARLTRIEIAVNILHRPGDCPVNNRVQKLELREAKQQGMVTVVGAIAGMIAAALLNVIFSIWKR